MFIDALAGYGHLSYDNKRRSVETHHLFSGDRTGKSLYALLALSGSLKVQSINIEPFLREDIVLVMLDKYQEKTNSPLGLAYEAMNVNTQATSVGLTISDTILFGEGYFMPAATLQYTLNSSGKINQGIYYADLGAAGGLYTLRRRSLPQHMSSLSLGLVYQDRQGRRSALKWMGSFGSNGSKSHTVMLEMCIPIPLRK